MHTAHLHCLPDGRGERLWHPSAILLTGCCFFFFYSRKSPSERAGENGLVCWPVTPTLTSVRSGLGNIMCLLHFHNAHSLQVTAQRSKQQGELKGILLGILYFHFLSVSNKRKKKLAIAMTLYLLKVHLRAKTRAIRVTQWRALISISALSIKHPWSAYGHSSKATG